MTKRNQPTRMGKLTEGLIPSHLQCVLYRIGDDKNFRWARSLPMEEGQAQHVVDDMALMGIPCYMERYSVSLAMGLPDLPDAGFTVILPEYWA